MEDVLIECSPGISGDMLLGAFFDLGVPKKVIEQPLVDLGLRDKYNLEFQESKSFSIRGIKAQVKNIDCGQTKRDWRSIKELILKGSLEERLQQKIYDHVHYGKMTLAKANKTERCHFYETDFFHTAMV